MSTSYSRPLLLEPGPSTALAGWLTLVHGLALLLPWLCRLPPAWSLLWSLGMLLLGGEALWALHRRRRYLPVALALGAGGELRLRWGDQRQAVQHRIRRGFRHPMLCVIRLQGFAGRSTLLLPRDCLSDDEHRRLRVYLTAFAQPGEAQSGRLLKGRGGSGSSTVGPASGKESG